MPTLPFDPRASEFVLSVRELVEASQRDTKEDRAKVNDHYVALAANLHLYAVWSTYRTTVKES